MNRARAVRQTSLRVRLGLVTLVFLVVVLVAVGMSTLMIRSWDRTLDRRVEVRQAANEIAELRLAFTDQETGIRGYMIGLDPVFLQPYDDGDAVARALLERLHARELDVAGFEEALGSAAMAADTWRTQIAEPTVADPANAPDDDLARIYFDTLRSELDEVDSLVRRELTELDREARQVRRNVFGVLFASAITAIAGTALAAMLFRRWVIRPLHRIGTAARALAEDDTYPLPQFDSPELQDVSDAVGSLQRSLRTARDEAVAAFSGLEQSAVLALQVRTQLANEIGQMPPGWSADSMLIPAEGVVAGDCFDLGLLDAEHLYVIMVDVTGHGASAALDALKAKSQLRAALRSRFAPGPAIDWLSREMLKDEHTDLLTASVAVINLTNGAVRYANAGHPPALVTDGEVVHELEPTGPLVGAFDASWSTAETTVPEGWTLIVHTDGVTDIVGEDRERFGDDRFRACFVDTDPTTLLECVRTTTDEFRVGPRTDDCTAIAVHRLLPSTAVDEVEQGDPRPDDTRPDDPRPEDAFPGEPAMLDDTSERADTSGAARDTVLP